MRGILWPLLHEQQLVDSFAKDILFARRNLRLQRIAGYSFLLQFRFESLPITLDLAARHDIAVYLGNNLFDDARWDVRGLAAHVVGSAAGQASPREFVRQVRTGKPIVNEIGAEFWWDGMNELHVRERAGHSAEELQAEWAQNSRRALRARRRSRSCATDVARGR